MPHNLRKLGPSRRAALFVEHVLPLFGNISPEYVRAYKSWSKAKDGGGRFRASDVFVWAVAVGEQSLARVLWRRVKNPIRQALLAAAICRRMGEKFELQQQILAAQADGYEAWASGAPRAAISPRSRRDLAAISPRSPPRFSLRSRRHASRDASLPLPQPMRST